MSIRLTAHVAAALDTVIFGFAVQEAALPFGADDVSDVAGGILEQVPFDQFPHVAEMAANHVLVPGYDFGDEFDYILELVLDSLEQRFLPSRTPRLIGSKNTIRRGAPWRRPKSKPEVTSQKPEARSGQKSEPGSRTPCRPGFWMCRPSMVCVHGHAKFERIAILNVVPNCVNSAMVAPGGAVPSHHGGDRQAAPASAEVRDA
jgi:hypothetical protein